MSDMAYEAQERAGILERLRLRLGLGREFIRYGFGSALALCVDYGLLILLTEWAHFHYLVSAAIGFTAGLIVVYVLSITVIFENRSVGNRWSEFAVFAVIGILGLGLNEILLFGFAQLSVSYMIAKIPTAGAVFLFNFMVRRTLLFHGRAAEEPA